MPLPDARPNPPARRALLLDFDGTLADTLPALRNVYATFLDRIGATAAAPAFDAVNGADLATLIPSLSSQFTPLADHAAAWRTYWQAVEDGVLASAPAPGAAALMSWARAQGWQLGIATSGRTPLIAAWLDRHELTPFIDAIVGADLCERPKPDPTVYQLLMRRLGVAPENSIAIEDSANGAAAARAAGTEVIRLAQQGDTDSQFVQEIESLAAALAYLKNRFDRVGDP